MRKELKSSLLTLVILIPIALLSLGITQADPGPTELAVDPSSIVDYAEVPGSTFHVNVTVADVSAMWGYEFTLTYDTFVLTATGFSSYSPFVIPWPSEINDTEGWVAVAYSMNFGELIGFSTVSPAPIARIDFTVDALGESALDLHSTILSDVYGQVIPHDVYDGYFRNVALELIPTASFIYTPLAPIEREEITFNASASVPNGGAIVNYTWVFGDGARVTETDPITTHNYTWRGNYILTLAVFDDEDIVGTVQHNVVVLAHDIAIVSVTTNTTEATAGESVLVTVIVTNEGHFTETFDVTVYRNETSIETQTPTLNAGVSTNLEFIWDTTGVPSGTYSISANATVLAYEYDTGDNTYIDGIVTITWAHDVAVIDVTTDAAWAAPGDTMGVTVVAENRGHFTETFNVTAYYDTTVIGTQTVTNLAPNANTTLIFNWDTTGAYGNYTIKAEASAVTDEEDLTDNILVDGWVYVRGLGDTNGDGIVDIFDIGTISAHWYPGPPIGPLGYDVMADINLDGSVDIFDIGITSANWGNTYP